jgi:hypothetical protein
MGCHAAIRAQECVGAVDTGCSSTRLGVRGSAYSVGVFGAVAGGLGEGVGSDTG